MSLEDSTPYDIEEARLCFTASHHPLYDNKVFELGRILLSAYQAIKAERDDADRRAGAAERSLEHANDRLLAHDRWNHDRKVERGYDPQVSFDVVYGDLVYQADRAKMLERHVEEMKGWLLIREAQHTESYMEVLRRHMRELLELEADDKKKRGIR